MKNEHIQIPPSFLINMSAHDARAALLKSESYFDLNLPPYFNFSAMLAALSTEMLKSPLPCSMVTNPQGHEGVNHIILENKDGRLASRPQEMIHPVVYVAMVHCLTEPSNWALLQQRASYFAQDSRIQCLSLPVVSNSDQSDKSAQILKWWGESELGSLELSLEFKYVLTTDVTDCYGSLFTHAIAWALHGKTYAQSREGRNDEKLFGNTLVSAIRSTRRNQTNGIPQGTNLSNLLAELVLGYGDLLISKALNEAGISNFKITRYRDDYRVFSNSQHDCDLIARIIGSVLRDFGLKLNPAKTALSNELVHAAVKEDKWYLLKNRGKPRGLINHLLIIHNLAREHPNSGSVSRVLTEFQRKIFRTDRTRENVGSMVGIVTDIAIHNPRTISIYASILSRMLTWVDAIDREQLLKKIRAKFEAVPHAALLELWLQRVTGPINLPFVYSEPLCRSVTDPYYQLWNSDWLPLHLQELVKAATYVDQVAFHALSPVVHPNEVQLFHYGG